MDSVLLMGRSVFGGISLTFWPYGIYCVVGVLWDSLMKVFEAVRLIVLADGLVGDCVWKHWVCWRDIILSSLLRPHGWR